MRILIIEDEMRLADALGQILKEARYQADVVYDGSDGLYYALEGNYDVVILDVMLPGKNGFEIASELRRHKKKVPVEIPAARDDVVFKGFSFSDVTLNLSICDFCCKNQIIYLRHKEIEILKIL